VAECSFDDGEAVACGTVFTADLVGLDGTHRLSVIARDAAGNVSAAVTSTYVLDTMAPAAPVLLHTPDPGDWTWRFSIEARATAECSVDGGPWTACASPLPGGPPGQTVRFEVRAVDRAGNRSTITRTTVTPAKASTVGPPPPGSSPPLALHPAPTDVGPTGGGGEVGETFAAARGVARPPVTALSPKASDEVQGNAMARRFRPEEGPFGGPVGELLQAAAETTTIPVLVILIVVAFVAVQNRIDRRDPKLAATPLRNEPEYMEFD
jgi:hypothetical protein